LTDRERKRERERGRERGRERERERERDGMASTIIRLAETDRIVSQNRFIFTAMRERERERE
jgi:hypothetical protein